MLQSLPFDPDSSRVWPQLTFTSQALESLHYEVDLSGPKPTSRISSQAPAPSSLDSLAILESVSPGFTPSETKFQTDLQRLPHIQYTSAGKSREWSQSKLYASFVKDGLESPDNRYMELFNGFMEDVGSEASPQIEKYCKVAFHQRGFLDMGNTLLIFLCSSSVAPKKTRPDSDKINQFAPVYRYFDIKTNQLKMKEIVSYDKLFVSSEDSSQEEILPIPFAIECVTSIQHNPDSGKIEVRVESFKILFPSEKEREEFQGAIAAEPAPAPSSPNRLESLKSLAAKIPVPDMSKIPKISGMKIPVMKIPGMERLSRQRGPSQEKSPVGADFSRFETLVVPASGPASQEFIDSRYFEKNHQEDRACSGPPSPASGTSTRSSSPDRCRSWTSASLLSNDSSGRESPDGAPHSP